MCGTGTVVKYGVRVSNWLSYVNPDQHTSIFFHFDPDLGGWTNILKTNFEVLWSRCLQKVWNAPFRIWKLVSTGFDMSLDADSRWGKQVLCIKYVGGSSPLAVRKCKVLVTRWFLLLLKPFVSDPHSFRRLVPDWHIECGSGSSMEKVSLLYYQSKWW